MSIARCRTVVGSLYALMRNALGLNVATSLESQEMSCTVAPDRRLVVLGHEPIAGFTRDHGTVADQAAMLALHTLDSTTLLAEPRFVAPGDSCLRTDDPGYRWHCISGHGQALSDWERRPLAGAIASVVAGAQPLDADLTAIAAQGVSAWGLTRLADSGATAAKNALGIQRADIGDASTAGRALMAVSTPSEASVPVISSAGAVTTAQLSSLVGGALLEMITCLAQLGVLAYYTADYGALNPDGDECSDGDAVAVWQDRSGNGYDLTPSSSSHRPTWHPAVVGGRAVVRFGAATQSNLLHTTLAIPARDHTIVAVARVTDPTQQFGRLWVSGLPTSGDDYTSPAAAELEASNFGDVAVKYIAQNTSTELSSTQVGSAQLPWGRYALRVARGNTQLSVDGVQSKDGSSPNSGSYTGFALGCYWTGGAPYAGTAGQLVGDEAFVAVFDRGLSDWELGWLLACLWAYYGI